MASKYIVNIPDADDYGVFLGLINGVESDHTFQEKFASFFSLQNEHRPFTARLISLIQFKLSGKLNFTWLMIIGNLFWIGAFIILMKYFKLKLGTLSFLGLVVLFFNLNHWENMYWATGSLQNFGVIFLMLLTFYLLHLKPKYHWGAILIAGLALYTSGNGLYVLIFTTVYLLIKGNWKIGIFSLAYAGILLFLYFRNYKSPSYLSSPLTNIITRPEMVLEYFFSYFSGSIYLLGFYEKWFVLVLGILIFVLSVGVLIKTFQSNSFIFMVTLFCLLSAASAAVSRSEMGYLQALTPRYQVIQTLLYAMIGFVFCRHWKFSVYIQSFLVVAFVGIFILSYTGNKGQINKYHTMFKRSAYCHSKEKLFNGYVFPIPVVAWLILLEAESKGVYAMPKVDGNYNCIDP
jgi:hypothetical protein